MYIAPFLESQPKPLRVADAVGEDLRQGAGRRHERIRGGDAVLAAAAVLAERVDAEDLAERGAEVLREPHRVAAAAAVADAHVEEPEVGRARTRRRIERDRAAVVIGERLAQPDQLARCRRRRRSPRPASSPSIRAARCRACVRRVGRREVRRRGLVRDVGVGVELAESRRAGLGELRVEREALQPALAALRLHGDAPLRIAEVEVRRHRLAVRTQGVEQAAHVADEQRAASPALRRGSSCARRRHRCPAATRTRAA